MRIGSLLVTLVGMTIASGSVYLARDFLEQSRGSAVAAPEGAMVEILVANEDIEFGTPVEAKMLAFQPWPREAVPEGAFTMVAAVTGDAQTEARRTRVKIFKGEVLLAPKLSGFGEKVTIVQKLGANTRAMAVKVDAESGVGGFVTPGDSVDILMTMQSGSDGLRAITVLQNIRVVGVDQKSAEELNQPGIARTVTLEVTPEQGQKLALAQKAGTLSLTLRTLDNVSDKPMDMILLRDLMQEKSPLPEEAKKPVILIRRGTITEEVAVN